MVFLKKKKKCFAIWRRNANWRGNYTGLLIFLKRNNIPPLFEEEIYLGFLIFKKAKKKRKNFLVVWRRNTSGRCLGSLRWRIGFTCIAFAFAWWQHWTASPYLLRTNSCFSVKSEAMDTHFAQIILHLHENAKKIHKIRKNTKNWKWTKEQKKFK